MDILAALCGRIFTDVVLNCFDSHGTFKRLHCDLLPCRGGVSKCVLLNLIDDKNVQRKTN